MATIKHISSKNADYGAAEAYLTFEHDEFTMKPTLDEAGRLIPRQDYRLDTLNCGLLPHPLWWHLSIAGITSAFPVWFLEFPNTLLALRHHLRGAFLFGLHDQSNNQ